MAAVRQPKRAHTNYSWFCNRFISILITLNTSILQGGRFFFQDGSSSQEKSAEDGDDIGAPWDEEARYL